MYNPQFPGGVPTGTVANTSGMGQASTVPAEIDRWNWGAFTLSIIWGIGNNTWIALLSLVPVVQIVMPFILGVKGSAWAWRNKRWQDVAHFRRVQRRWAIAGLIVWFLWMLLIAGAVALPVLIGHKMLTHHPVRELAFTAVRTSPEATTLLGTPIQTVDSSGRDAAASSQGGVMEVRFVVAGPQGSATVEARGHQTQGKWELERVMVRPSSGGPPLMVLPRQRL